jgi:hypothetical protein
MCVLEIGSEKKEWECPTLNYITSNLNVNQNQPPTTTIIFSGSAP